MFETIGLAIATAIFFLLAAIASAILAGLTWLFVRKRKDAPRKRLILTAILIPIFSAAYMWLCVALLPGESLFGDIDEPLPNGYAITALGKMPDFASIVDRQNPKRDPQLSEYIGKIVIVGQLVGGEYSHPFGTFDPHPNELYFILDTSSGKTIDLRTFNELQTQLGHPAQLTEVQYFQSPFAAARRRLNKTIEFGPPMAALLLLAIFVGRSVRNADLYRSLTTASPEGAR